MDDDLNTPMRWPPSLTWSRTSTPLSDASDKATLETAAKTFDELTGVLGLLATAKKTDAIPAEVTAPVEDAPPRRPRTGAAPMRSAPN